MPTIHRTAGCTVLALTLLTASAQSPPPTLDAASAAKFAKLVLAGIDREYPNKPGDVLTGPEDILSPRQLHPSFFGSFDWHSSLHGHWMLIRLLKQFPQMENAGEIRQKLATHLAPDKIATEAAYFDQKENRSFERMYGWAWTLRLAAELKTWDDPMAKQWSVAFAPLEQKIVMLTKDYLPRLTYPVRTGVHPDTAFALSQALDYARTADDIELESLVTQRAREYYLTDRDYPIDFEPSGQDFFSAGLNVADLMRRVLPAAEFSKWLNDFAPGVRRGRLGSWGTPAIVSDLTDPQIVHLVGLNLSRAWTLQGVASALPEGDRRRKTLEASMQTHAAEGVKYVFSGHYEGEHWLATFAVYYLSRSGIAAKE